MHPRAKQVSDYFDSCMLRRATERNQQIAQERAQQAALEEAQKEIERRTEEWERSVEEAKQKGPEYARTSGTKWAIDRKKNEMTDKEEVSVTSDQSNQNGAVAHVFGHCLEGSAGAVLVFDALITDEGGKSSVQLPGIETKLASDYSGAMHKSTSLWALQRRNDLPPEKAAIPSSEGFDNEFRIWGLNPVSRRIVPTKSWRLITQITTDRGDLIIKIPVYDPAVQQAYHACVPDQDLQANTIEGN